MKNKTKISYSADHSQAEPFNTVIACTQCSQEKKVTVYPALGDNWFECQNCLKVNMVELTPEMEACHD
jgi:serine protease inhibitor ecotin